MTRGAGFKTITVVSVALAALLWSPSGPSPRQAHGSDPDLREPSTAAPPVKPRRKARPAKPAPPPRDEPEESEGSPSAPSSPSGPGSAIALPSPVESLMSRARAALQAGRLAEPEGENAIELARAARLVDPRDPRPGLVEASAARALANRAAQAAAQGDKALALRVYERLLQLFPGKEPYLSQARALRAPSIAGEWNWRVHGLISVNLHASFRTDGTCLMVGFGIPSSGHSGTWRLVDPKARAFVANYTTPEGHFDSMTLSEDGHQMSARCSLGPRITATRLSGPPR